MGEVIEFTKCSTCLYLRRYTKTINYECSECGHARRAKMDVFFQMREMNRVRKERLIILAAVIFWMTVFCWLYVRR